MNISVTTVTIIKWRGKMICVTSLLLMVIKFLNTFPFRARNEFLILAEAARATRYLYERVHWQRGYMKNIFLEIAYLHFGDRRWGCLRDKTAEENPLNCDADLLALLFGVSVKVVCVWARRLEIWLRSTQLKKNERMREKQI